MKPWLDDGDVRLYHGDALDVLRDMPDGSVDCVVTSPPYWGLRDYGTGEWEGGDPDHEHETIAARNGRGGSGAPGKQTAGAFPSKFAKEYCECGARHLDRQLGLETTPDLFVANMVAVFREIRRVLADHGTCWVNLGDSYAANRSYQVSDSKHQAHDFGGSNAQAIPDGLKPKDLVGIPWRVAFALQADGWYLRSDIVWAKPNPMPESVTDRPTKAHEYVFLLTKQPRYFFDSEAVREPNTDDMLRRAENGHTRGIGSRDESRGDRFTHAGTREILASGRNVRSVWNIATQSYPEAHFATFPEELARRCILAGCPVRVCRVCGKPSERVIQTDYIKNRPSAGNDPRSRSEDKQAIGSLGGHHGWRGNNLLADKQTVGWSDCGHNDWRPGQILDPFIGSGTVAKVARDHQRHAIGIDLNEQYLELAAKRLQQLSLLNA